MANSKYVSFLEEIIAQTKDGTLKWSYLDTNDVLCSNMGWKRSPLIQSLLPYSHDDHIFNTDDSFFTQIGETYLVLYVCDDNPASMYVVPQTYKKIVVFEPDVYGKYITRLLNLVLSQFPSGEQFIDNYLNESHNNHN